MVIPALGQQTPTEWSEIKMKNIMGILNNSI